jgi:protein-tyrosine phosphatase
VGGATILPTLAIRSDDLSTITETDAEQLVARGVTNVIDLRSGKEAELTGRGPLGRKIVAYHNLPLMDGARKVQPPRHYDQVDHEHLGRTYVEMAERAAPQLAMALSIIALSTGTTAFHCTAGRDRTGVLAAMLLLALGVDDEQIVADYALTEANMPAVDTRTKPMVTQLLALRGIDISNTPPQGPADEPLAVAMEVLLRTLRAQYQDPLMPLRAAGLSPDTITRLRERAGVSR